MPMNEALLPEEETLPKDDDKVCFCKKVTYGQIKEAMAGGATTVEDIKKTTGAGTACGGCISTIEKILKGEEA